MIENTKSPNIASHVQVLTRINYIYLYFFSSLNIWIGGAICEYVYIFFPLYISFSSIYLILSIIL